MTAWATLSRILDRHATILHAQRYSDVALGLSLEVPGHQLAGLRDALKEHMQIDGDPAPLTNSELEWSVLLNVTFLEGTGNVTIEVPMVPG